MNACSKILKFNCPDVDGKQDEALQEDSCRWMDWENNLRAFAYQQTRINALILNLWHQIFCIEMFKWYLIIWNQKTFFCGYWSFWNPSSIPCSLKLSNTFSSNNLWWKSVATAPDWPSCLYSCLPGVELPSESLLLHAVLEASIPWSFCLTGSFVLQFCLSCFWSWLDLSFEIGGCSERGEHGHL